MTKILFDPIKHTYFHTELEEYFTSPSSVMNKLTCPFKATEEKTKSTREKLGISHEEVLQLWKQNNKKSLIYGTYIHLMVENYFSPSDEYIKYFAEHFDILSPHIEEFIEYGKFLKSLNIKKGKKKFITEGIVYDESLKMAGTVDLQVHKKNTIDIWDWKSNQKALITWFPAKGYYNPPYEFWKNADINKYRLQINFYAYMAKRMYNKEIGKLRIAHFYRKGCQVYDIDYDESLVERWIDFITPPEFPNIYDFIT